KARRKQAARRRLRPEERKPSEAAVDRPTDVVLDDRAEDEDAPESEHDARDRGQHLDQRADDTPDGAGRELGEVEPDRDRDRSGDQQRADRGVERPPDEGQRSERLLADVPGPAPDEREPELLHGGPRALDRLVDDDPDQRDAAGGSETGDAREHLVAELVDDAAARLERFTGRLDGG